MKNKVYYLDKGKKFEVIQAEMKPLNKDYVRVQNLYCGICGGDYSCFLGRRQDYPYSLGHEFVARIHSVGSSVDNLQLGDLVISDFNYRCGMCEYCINGLEHLCTQNNIQKFSNRAFAKFSDIHYSYLYKVNSYINLHSATLIEPLSCVIHASNFFTKSSLPQSILIIGTGSIGMLFAFYLKHILCIPKVHVYDKIMPKMERVCYHFDTIPFNPTKNCEVDYFELIIDATNSIDGCKLGLKIAKPGQSYCMMSHLYGLDTSFIYESICQKELSAFFPLRNGNRTNLDLACNLIVNKWKSSYDDMLNISPINDIQSVFSKKERSSYNKQVLCISDSF